MVEQDFRLDTLQFTQQFGLFGGLRMLSRCLANIHEGAGIPFAARDNLVAERLTKVEARRPLA